MILAEFAAGVKYFGIDAFFFARNLSSRFKISLLATLYASMIPFFLILGVNWHSYVFHAAIINTLFSITIFYLFKSFNLNQFFSTIFALSVGILAYPSIGTPFVDHHATIAASLAFVITTGHPLP